MPHFKYDDHPERRDKKKSPSSYSLNDFHTSWSHFRSFSLHTHTRPISIRSISFSTSWHSNPNPAIEFSDADQPREITGGPSIRSWSSSNVDGSCDHIVRKQTANELSLKTLLDLRRSGLANEIMWSSEDEETVESE